MSRADIIRMARESTLMVDFQKNGLPYFPALERFAELVAAAEREECAKVCDKHTRPIDDPLAPVGQHESGSYITAEFLADAIRARGNDAA